MPVPRTGGAAPTRPRSAALGAPVSTDDAPSRAAPNDSATGSHRLAVKLSIALAGTGPTEVWAGSLTWIAHLEEAEAPAPKK